MMVGLSPTDIINTLATGGANPSTLNQVQNDSSTAVPTPPQVFDPGPTGINLNGTVVNPNTTIPSAAAQQSTIQTYQFPDDIPKYYFQINLAQYTRQSIQVVGNTIPYATIVLPLPQNLIEQREVNWQEADIGKLIGGTAQIASNLGASKLEQAGAAAIVAGGVAVAEGAGNIGNIGQGIEQGLQAGGQAIGTLFGAALNSFMTMIFTGPKYRRLGFKWKLIPKNAGEAESIRGIVQVLNNAMAPSLDSTGLVWLFPDIATCAFYPNSKWLYKFKPAAIANMTVNYAPGGVPAFYYDKSGPQGTDNAPESIELTISFTELEFWIKGNFTGSNDPSDVEFTTPQSLAADVKAALGSELDRLQAAAKAGGLATGGGTP